MAPPTASAPGGALAQGIVAVTDALPIFLDTALKGGLVVALAAVAAAALHRRSAAARHAVWTAAVGAHLALPVLTVTVPGVRVPGLPLLPPPPWLTAEAAATEGSRPTALTVVAALWLLGTLVVSLRLALATWQVTRLTRASRPVTEAAWPALGRAVALQAGIARPVALRYSDALAVPITYGARRPVVLLPASADAWPDDRRRLVLVHEFAHVRRWDALTQLGAQLAVAIFWFDPLLWLAAARMHAEREHACDDVVLRDGAAASRYAGELLDFARRAGATRYLPAAPGVAALAMVRPAGRRTAFATRLRAILDADRDRAALSRQRAAATALVAGLLTPPLAALRPFRSPPVSPRVQFPAPAVPRPPAPSTR